MKNKKLLLGLVVGTILTGPSTSTAAPFFDNCLDLVSRLVGAKSSGPVDLNNIKNAHPSFGKVTDEIRARGIPQERFNSLPELEQSLEEFKDTGVPYIKYFYNPRAHLSQGMDHFIENTMEIIYTPHSSHFGHVRLRIGNKLYGYENVKRTFNTQFSPTALYKEQRQVKKIPGRGEGKKEGNMGAVFTLTAEDKEIIRERQGMINLFYTSSQEYNIPPFDGAGAKQVKLIVDDNGNITYHSPTGKSNFGNFAKATGKIEKIGDQEFLVSPSGFKHPISLNAKGERVVEAYSCASSVNYVIEKILGKKIADKPYAGSFMTYLKNGAEGGVSPDAIIHYYSSSDI